MITLATANISPFEVWYASVERWYFYLQYFLSKIVFIRIVFFAKYFLYEIYFICINLRTQTQSLLLASFDAIFSFPKCFFMYFLFFIWLCLSLVTFDAILRFLKYFLCEIFFSKIFFIINVLSKIFLRNNFCPKYFSF